MKERPILLNGDMVRAVLNGSKTQTRRIMRLQPESNQFGLLRITDSTKRSDIGKYHWAESNGTGTHTRSALFSCPFGAVGDRLWVRETFCPVNDDGEKWIDYRATPRFEQSHPAGWDCEPKDPEALKWRPSIHMPRWACRITLEITGVRVERLASVSNEDARAEGYPAERAADGGPLDAWLWFRDLWDGIYPEQSFKVNPWVWVIEFRREEGE